MNLDLDRRTLGLLAGVLVAAVAATMFLTGRGQSAEPVALASMAAVPLASAVAASPEPIGLGAVAGGCRSGRQSPAAGRVDPAGGLAGARRARGSRGARPGVDTTDQNLARVLVDGEQIRIGLRPAPAGDPGHHGQHGRGADRHQHRIDGPAAADPRRGSGTGAAHCDLPGAERGFQAVEQLTEVSGIGEATFAQMQPMVTVGAGG